jgi:hypothetical protein
MTGTLAAIRAALLPFTVRDHVGRYASAAPHDAPLLVARSKSAPHIKGAATKHARWIVKRDAMTARLMAFNQSTGAGPVDAQGNRP